MTEDELRAQAMAMRFPASGDVFEVVPLDAALAAVAAERERIVKLLRNEAASGAIEKRTLFAYAADLIEQAREGDTTGSNE